MSDIYRFIFGAPRVGEVPKPARWTSARETLGPGGTAARFDFSTHPATDLSNGTYIEVDIYVPAPASPPAKGVTGSANIIIHGPKWPVPCEAALQIELGHALDKWRTTFSYTPYSAGSGSDFAARKLKIRYYASGDLTVTGDLPELKYDLPALSKPGDDQQLHVVVIPEQNQHDPQAPGSTAEIAINGGTPVLVTG